MFPEIEEKSQKEIKKFQEQKLGEQLHYVAQHSKFYQRRFKEEGIDISTIQTLEDLKQIPVTTKDDLQKWNKDFFCVEAKDIIDISSTSGTTGKPIDFILTDNDLNRLAYNEAISFACAGISDKDTVQLMTTMDRRFMAGMAYFLGLRKLGASVIRTGSGIPALQWESIIHNKPTYLIVVPSFLLKMISYAEQKGIDLNSTSVKGAICIGEPLRNQDFSPSTLAQRINEKWNIQLYSTYASTEMSTAFTECSEQHGGHFHPELIITEVLDENNQIVEEGEIGELTITTLGVEGLPLVRYKTGDLVQVHSSNCACGRNTYRIGPVLGRSQQMIKYKGTTLFPPSIQDVINQFDAISGHVIILQKNDLNNDDIIVKIVSQNTSSQFLKELQQEFQAKIRVIPSIEFIESEELNSILISANSRKPKFVIDKR